MTDDAKKANPFSVAALRLNQDFASLTPVKKEITLIKVGKPSKQDFIRVHQSEDYRVSPLGLIITEDDGECYAVAPELAPEVLGELKQVTLYLVINRQETISLWPVPLPDADGKWNQWHQSADLAAKRAMQQWTRVKSNRNAGMYEAFVALEEANIPPPQWPEKSMDQLLEIAFRDRLISDYDHPVLRQLRGAV
jgi:uncharacterized protein YbdZ (MbtH family)